MTPDKCCLSLRRTLARVSVTFCMLCTGIAAAQAPGEARLGLVGFVGEATNYRALDREYFRAEGLDVKVTRNAAGVQGLRQVMRGELDIATTAPTPVVYAAMGRFPETPDFRVIACILESSSMNRLVILDRDRLGSLAGLAGKRLALTRATASEYFWYLLALQHDIDRSSVEIVDLPVTKLAEAAREGQFDAAIAWPPFDQQLLAAVPTRGQSVSAEHIYTTAWLVVARPAFIAEHPDRVQAYLRALVRAEQDVHQDAQAVARSQAKFVDASVDSLLAMYPTLDFDLSLTEVLLVNLSQQAQWALDNDYANGPVPEFRSYIDPAPLAAVRAASIRLLQ